MYAFPECVFCFSLAAAVVRLRSLHNAICMCPLVGGFRAHASQSPLRFGLSRKEGKYIVLQSLAGQL